jgi:hypothetical protein
MKQKKTALASATAKTKDPEAWVTAKPKTERAAEKPARLVVELPAELHRKLKGKCGLKGLKIKDVINELLQEWVKT